MEDENARMAAMQAKFEETIAKLQEDFTARLRVLQASNKSMWYSWYEVEAAPLTGDTVFPDASVERATGQLTLEESSAGTASSDAVAEAASLTGDTAAPDASVKRAARQLTLEESSAGTASSDTVAEVAPLTGDTAAPDASAERVARKLTLKAGSSSEICSERGASTHPFDPGTVFPLEVRYHKDSWLQHGSSSNSNNNNNSSSSSNSNGSSSSNNHNTNNYGPWWDTTCVVALLRPFDPGKGCQWGARRGRAILGVDLTFDRGKAQRRIQHEGRRASC